MASVTVHEVVKEFGQIRALDNVCIDFADGDFHALVGPSGCGKTTLLRLIAGFDFPTSGQILFSGEPVDSIAVERRNVGMVFQNYALFPNMDVKNNVGFGLGVRDIGHTEQRRRIQEVLDLVQLSGLEDRRPHELSGGQKQRVALARAIVIRPRVLLLDEPLSALDKSLRSGMQIELKRIQRETGITTIFVTHDQEEALTLSDRLGIIRDGVLVQEGTPNEVYERPNSAFAATFLGDANLFAGRTVSRGAKLDDDTIVKAAEPLASTNGQEITIAVRPEKMMLLTGPGSPILDPAHQFNEISATVVQGVFAGSSLTYLLDWCGQEIKVFVQNQDQQTLAPGQCVKVAWQFKHTMVVES